MEKTNNPGMMSGMAKQTAAIMAGKIIALIATFAIPLFLTRYLTKFEYGMFSQFYVITNFCIIIFSLGIQSNLYFFYPKATEKERKSLIAHTILLLLIYTLVAISLINIPFIGKFLIGNGDLQNYKMFISLGILFLMPLIIAEPLYVAKNDNITSMIFPPIEVLLRLIFVIGFALLWHTLNAILLGIIFAGFSCFIFVVLYSLKGIKIKELKYLIDFNLAKSQLKYSWPFGLALILNTLALQFDKIICISFLAPTAFATYSIAFYGIPGVEQIYQSLSQVYLLKMSAKHHENKPSEISEIYKSLVTKTYSFSIPAIAIMSLYAKRIISLFFTDKYIDAVPLFRLYILTFLVFMLGAGLILRATNRTSYSLRAYFYSSLITLPLTYFLIKYYGLWGGITSAMISIVLPKAIQLHYEMRLLKSNIITYFPWKKFLTIASISILTIIPFVLLEYFILYGTGLMVIFGTIYLLIVSLLEIKFNVFIFENISIEYIVKRLSSKMALVWVRNN